jgi:FkbM family methyltransferase
MSRLFLDVGAHTGQTVDAVRDPVFAFDRIVCFEPARRSQEVLARIADGRIQVEPFGLWKETCEREIFEPGRKGASIFSDKNRIDAAAKEVCRLVRASDWFRENVREGDAVFLKLNCEGCECDVVEDLLDSGEFRKVASALIFLDVEKIPSQAHRAAELRERLRQEGSHRGRFASEFSGASHRRRIHAWLEAAGARAGVPRATLRQWVYEARRGLIGVANGTLDAGLLTLLRKVVPGGLYSRLQSAWRRAQGRRA